MDPCLATEDGISVDDSELDRSFPFFFFPSWAFMYAAASSSPIIDNFRAKRKDDIFVAVFYANLLSKP